jgi:hypothetical protein
MLHSQRCENAVEDPEEPMQGRPCLRNGVHLTHVPFSDRNLSALQSLFAVHLNLMWIDTVPVHLIEIKTKTTCMYTFVSVAGMVGSVRCAVCCSVVEQEPDPVPQELQLVCQRGTGTVMHSGSDSGTGFRPGSKLEANFL